MKHFDIKDPRDWQSIAPREVLLFEATGGYRKVFIALNATDKVAVFVASDEAMTDAKLLAASDGMFSLQFSTQADAYVQFIADEDTCIFVTGPARSQLIPASVDESYTTVKPRGRRNTDLDRMMLLFKHNEARRERQLSEQVQRMQQQLDAKRTEEPVIEPTPEPKAEEPKPAKKGNANDDVSSEGDAAVSE